MLRRVFFLVAIVLIVALMADIAFAQSATSLRNAFTPPAKAFKIQPLKPSVVTPPPTIRQAISRPTSPPPMAPVGQNLSNLPKKPPAAPAIKQVVSKPPSSAPMAPVSLQKKITQDKLHVDRPLRSEPEIKPTPLPKPVITAKANGQPSRPVASLQDTFRARGSLERLKRQNSTKLSPRARGELNAAIYKAEKNAQTISGRSGNQLRQRDRTTRTGAGGGGNGGNLPPKGKVQNMDQFLKTDFGRKLGNNSRRTGKVDSRQGQKVLQATKPHGKHIDKGDYWHLDNSHATYTEIEIYNKRRQFKVVLNIDGTRNAAKTDDALKEGRKLRFKGGG